MSTDFYKYHALGNDYIVIDPNKTQIDLNAERISLICHRNFGVGSDGILFGPLLAEDQVRLRIFNPDGSEAEKSGNGVRIFSRYLLDANYISDDHFTLNTLGGEVRVEILDEKASRIKVDMGTVTFQSQRIPVSGTPREVVDEPLRIKDQTLRITCVSIGNPHCIIPMDNISKAQAMALGPLIETHPMFPNKINVQFLKVIDDRNIQIEIWERGAGYTLASGSSSCAAACAAYRLGLAGNQVNVHMPGGVLEIDIRADGHVSMTGTVSSVASGKFSDEFWARLR